MIDTQTRKQSVCLVTYARNNRDSAIIGPTEGSLDGVGDVLIELKHLML